MRQKKTTGEPVVCISLVDCESNLLAIFLQRFFSLSDVWSTFNFVCVELNKALPLFRNIVLVENGFYWAFWNTSLTVNALIRVDVEHLIAFVKALDRAHYNTIGIAASVARFGYYMCH
jgi:hypothetical protein